MKIKYIKSERPINRQNDIPLHIIDNNVNSAVND